MPPHHPGPDWPDDAGTNALAESFFSLLKMELIHDRAYLARHEVFEYIEVLYNRIRRHSALDDLSPADFELAQVA